MASSSLLAANTSRGTPARSAAATRAATPASSTARPRPRRSSSPLSSRWLRSHSSSHPSWRPPSCLRKWKPPVAGISPTEAQPCCTHPLRPKNRRSRPGQGRRPGRCGHAVHRGDHRYRERLDPADQPLERTIDPCPDGILAVLGHLPHLRADCHRRRRTCLPPTARQPGSARPRPRPTGSSGRRRHPGRGRCARRATWRTTSRTPSSSITVLPRSGDQQLSLRSAPTSSISE